MCQTRMDLELYWLCTICSVIMSSTALTDKYNKVHRDILADYNPEVRPCTGCKNPLEISVAFHMTSLNKINEIEGELNSVGYLKVVWQDDRLTCDPRAAGLASFMFHSKRVWIPPITLGNPSRVISDLNAEDALVRVLYNGTVIWLPGDVFHSKCEYDVQNYPFDRQICHVTFTPWSYTAEEIRLFAPDNGVHTPFFPENGEWKLGDTSSLSYVKNGISLLQFELTFIRRSEFFVVNVILPILFLSLLDCLAFVIPIQSGERISYTITILLSFAVFMTLVSDNIPKTSAPMSFLCYYLTSLFIGSVLVMVSVAISMRLFYTDSLLPVPSTCGKIARIFCCCKERKCENYAPVEITRLDERNGTTSRQDVNTDGNVTWCDVAHAFDMICFVFFLMYYVSITIGMITYISE